MIGNTDRSGWFGASDSLKIMTPNHDTKSWKMWWLEKLGIEKNEFHNVYTDAGTRFEHPILEAFDKGINMDRQLIIEDKLLRVNYDGDKDGIIYEVKTHKSGKDFEITKYIEAQIQTEMYVWKEKAKSGEVPEFKDLIILSYAMTDADYNNMEPTVDDIDFDRIKVNRTKYKSKHVKRFLKCLEPLAEDLKREKAEHTANGEEMFPNGFNG